MSTIHALTNLLWFDKACMVSMGKGWPIEVVW